MFEQANWIWAGHPVAAINEYADFSVSFQKGKGTHHFFICSKGDFVIYLNGSLLGAIQFPDFPEKKVYDDYDATPFLCEGKNNLFILALSRNYDTSGRIADGKGIIFEMRDEEGILFSSNASVLSRIDPHYVSGNVSRVTTQLGMGYSYCFSSPETSYGQSVIVPGGRVFVPRPVPRCELIRQDATCIRHNLYGFSKESVGYLFFTIDSPEENLPLRISYGEHLIDGGVRRLIQDRDFSVSFTLKKGANVFFGPFLRMGLRYLEMDSAKVCVREIGIYASHYPHHPFVYAQNPIRKDVAEAAALTLDCCLHEHYEDCPWREQAQYTMDAHLEILLGYEAFGEYRMPRSALSQMAFRLTKQHTLPITSPCATELSIPTYSLIYPLLLREYWEQTHDRSLLEEVFPNLKLMMDHYVSMAKGGLLTILPEWNFFEWADGLDRSEEIFHPKENSKCLPFLTNAFFVVGLEAFSSVLDSLGRDASSYRALLSPLRKQLHDLFYDENKRRFAAYFENGTRTVYCEFAQVMALYAHIALPEEREELLSCLRNPKDLVPLTLCNYLFKYQVLLEDGKNDAFIAQQVNQIWGSMLKQGTTTDWETIKGADDFSGAGSLCHGWSAVPLYVYYRLAKRKAPQQAEQNPR